MIQKILIANRGEIALRIKRACDDLGIQSVCTVSEVDKAASFASYFDEVVVVGPAPAAQSYLNQAAILEGAKKMGCDAIHPGYGFLSETASFAKAVIDSGLIFIGPTPQSIEALGDKTKARSKVQEYGVPCVPGTEGNLSDEELIKQAAKIGYPVIIKASAGGGGRGMRVVRSEHEVVDAIHRARAEAKKFFSSDEVFLEKYIVDPRHVEVQLFGDSFGNIVHLGTRDCSSQRRHQKIIEEAPAPNLSDTLRERIHQAAVNAAKSVGYKNAGTAEFLVAGEEFYFLEMNTRIQVEHPITEEITGIDLVRLQLQIANGEALPFTQKEISFAGHAIELRVYAEDPKNDFRPSLGKLSRLSWGNQAPKSLRKEFGFSAGDTISPYYDAMIGKIIVKEKTRSEAIESARRSLHALVIDGVETNRQFLDWLLLHPSFKNGTISIQEIEKTLRLEDILAIEKRFVRDPHHKGDAAPEHIEFVEYKSNRFGVTYTIEVKHHFDGLFIVTPFLKAAERPKALFRRRSNSFKKALESLKAEVLEQVSPEDLFSK